MAKSRNRTESASPDQQQRQSGSGQQVLDSGADAGDSRDRISARAYELYLQRGGADGGAFDDWLAAEREVGSASLDGPNPGGRDE
jgi:hypothetical protein